MIQYQILSKFVPRHSYKPGNLYLCRPDSYRELSAGKNTRHASLLTAVYRDPARNRRAVVVTAFRRSATFTFFIAGPLGVTCGLTDDSNEKNFYL